MKPLPTTRTGSPADTKRKDIVERTLTIIKPDAMEQHVTGKILARLEEEGFRIVAARLVRMSEQEAGGFYAVHKERPFYGDLCRFMSSGPAMPWPARSQMAS